MPVNWSTIFERLWKATVPPREPKSASALDRRVPSTESTDWWPARTSGASASSSRRASSPKWGSMDPFEKVAAKSQEIVAVSEQAEVYQQRYQAHLLLHNAAAAGGVPEEIELRRRECHDLLD